MNTNVRFVDKILWSFKNIQHNYLKQRLATKETALVETTQGTVKGAKRLTIYGQPYYSFEAIPYAKPPINELRFKAPQPLEPWQDIKDCTREPNKSVQIQFVYNKVEGSEDCLYLNVYTNNLTPAEPRPVMVWIHGGGFIIGEASRDWYGPDYFMHRDVVLVTVQYRLGVLGFLSLNTPELDVPGNAGLKDQVMALQWVKQNCAAFGGDPDCITVFGESAGGASTHYLSITEKTRGLFHRHIVMSGNARAPWALNDCAARAFKLGEVTGFKGQHDEKQLLEHLRQAKADDLIRVETSLLQPEEKHKVMFSFGPVIEPYSTPSCVVPTHPREMQKNAWTNALPLLIGCTSYEGLLFKAQTSQAPEVLKDLETCLDFVPAELADPNRSSPETIRLGQDIKRIHVKGEHPVADDYFDLCSHYYFWFPLQRLLRLRLANEATAPTFLYRFDFDSENIINPYRLMRYGRGVSGVAHADELSYLFWNCLAKKLSTETREYHTIQRMTDIWVEFATTGNPHSPKIDGLANTKWEPLEKNPDATHWTLNISDELTFIELPEMPKMRQWQKLFDGKPELL